MVRQPTFALSLVLVSSIWAMTAVAQEESVEPEPEETVAEEALAEDEETAGFVQRLAIGVRVNPIM